MSGIDVPADEPTRLRERLDRIGLPGLVDVHTHFMPAPMLDKVWAYFDRAGPLTGRAWPIAYRHSEDVRVATLRALGVERFTSLTYPHKPGMAEWLNAWTTEFADRHPDCLRSATFFPEAGAASYVREAIDAGAQVFKAHVQVGGYDPADPLLDGVWVALEEAGTPIVTHVGNGPAPGAHTGPRAAAELLRRYPDLTLVVAHLGLPDYGAFLDLAAVYPRVHLDTTMVFTAFTEADNPFPASRRGDLLALSERILFGSDYPNIPYAYLEAVDAVLGLGLGDDWARGVLRENARRLFRL
ncbi:amidohydrolase family protein [Nocardioides speluncae]|uniref:amidohydrolase family protein n=1 Tax=Nocardioides speluncae TaxID=2670337 RepID=UPI001F0C57B3|nr:amidohydrolase family protein [Nocardioides speluncae]